MVNKILVFIMCCPLCFQLLSYWILHKAAVPSALQVFSKLLMMALLKPISTIPSWDHQLWC